MQGKDGQRYGIGYRPYMVSLRVQFHHYYIPGADAVKAAIQTGLVTPDTNVLLSAYRFQAGARDELFGALEKLGNRLWIPYQVGLEFHNRRLDVMSEQEGYFKKTSKELDDSVTAVRGKVRAFRSRIALSTDDLKEIEDGITRLRDLIGRAVLRAEEFNEIRLDDHSSDQVLARIDALFPDGRVGEPMTSNELEKARKEADQRVREKIPPGYKDKAKDDPSGDYLIWRQLMNEAAARKLPVVFITDDTKEDWYQEFKGRTLGARRELREEMMEEAGVPVFIMTTENFLRVAKEYLNAKVSPETVDQAQEILSSAAESRARQNIKRALAERDFQNRHREMVLGQLAKAVTDVAIIREQLDASPPQSEQAQRLRDRLADAQVVVQMCEAEIHATDIKLRNAEAQFKHLQHLEFSFFRTEEELARVESEIQLRLAEIDSLEKDITIVQNIDKLHQPSTLRDEQRRLRSTLEELQARKADLQAYRYDALIRRVREED